MRTSSQIILLSLSFLTLSAQNLFLQDDSYMHYQAIYNKNYVSKTEYERRREIYNRNFDYIQKTNA